MISLADKQVRLLHQLSRLYGIETVYRDVRGRFRPAAANSLLAALRVMGAPVEKTADIPGALREFRQATYRQCCEPVTIAWDNEPARITLKLRKHISDQTASYELEMEDGESRSWTDNLRKLPVLKAESVEGIEYIVKEALLPFRLPLGYHRLRIVLPDLRCETLIISAPSQAYFFPLTNNRTWGVFIPLYALYSEQSWGAGDLSDLGSLQEWVSGLGGSFVGTLPLLATFLSEPFDPSPYAPVSRLFWNEFYLDVTRAPELEYCPPAQDFIDSVPLQEELVALRAAPMVNYRRIMELKRNVLEKLARCCLSNNRGRRSMLLSWVENHPAVRDYARFRAVTEKERKTWPNWPERMRDGVLLESDCDSNDEYYHIYVQWLLNEQFQHLSKKARQNSLVLNLDLPIGVHAGGYDVWRERAIFATEANIGAPPDRLFTQGQNWGFPPLHPEKIRTQGYRYYISCLRNLLKHAGILRLDHVMGLHRLFWVPRGLPVREGVYVRYRSEEFYAILTLESHRHRSQIVGEDLGTVPRYVRSDMSRHKIHRMYILPFELTPDPKKALRPVPENALAGLNTHDMPPFTSFWLGKDMGNRVELPEFLLYKGWIKEPTDSIEVYLKACLSYLAASRAPILLVNLEDLWLETAPQNIPGTGDRYPNWKRKARHPIENFSRMPEVRSTLEKINHLRRRGKNLKEEQLS